jgi:trimethylamine--corrinoid protein Co-methyltransferase
MKFLNILSTEDLKRIHRKALMVLERVGCIVEHQGALASLHDAGVQVDFPNQRARIAGDIVESALASIPKQYLATGRTPDDSYEVQTDMPPKFRCIGGALKWLSFSKNDGQQITQNEARQMLCLADALPQVDLVGTPFVSDFPQKTYDIHSLRLALSKTTKHIWSLTISSKNLRYQMKLLETVMGDRENLKTHKRISGIVCILDPLKFSHDEIERLKIYGDYQVPVKWTSSSMIGGNAPYSVSGALVQNVAQLLAGLLISAYVTPGIPVVYYTTLQEMDMRKGYAIFGSPDLMVANAAIAQIARYYQLPSAITCLNSNGSEGGQSIFQRSMGLINCMMAGAGEINIAGALDGGAFFSPEFAVLDNEFIAYLRRFREGLVIDKGDNELEIIARNIEKGEYLSDAQTLECLRQGTNFMSELFDYRDHESWFEKDSATLVERAREKAVYIIETHQVDPLDDAVEKELDAIVAAADKELLG